jgi:RimJ/RimL family protein N-acetyltransferase
MFARSILPMSRRIPPLETNRLLIRELHPDDLTDVNTILNDAFGTKRSIAYRRAWLEWTVLGYAMFAGLGQPPYGERGVALRETDALIGVVGIVPCLDAFDWLDSAQAASSNRTRAEVGLFWAIAPSHQGQGFATEAAAALAAQLFMQEDVWRLIATTEAENLSSQRVMEKLGMTVQRRAQRHAHDQSVVGVLYNPDR